jgi:hypothetical protein
MRKQEAMMFVRHVLYVVCIYVYIYCMIICQSRAAGKVAYRYSSCPKHYTGCRSRTVCCQQIRFGLPTLKIVQRDLRLRAMPAEN